MNLLRDSKEDIIKLLFRESLNCPLEEHVPVVLCRDGSLVPVASVHINQTINTMRFVRYVKGSTIYDWVEELNEVESEEGHNGGYYFINYPDEILSYSDVVDIVADKIATDEHNELHDIYETFHSQLQTYLVCHRCLKSVVGIVHEQFNTKYGTMYICRECIGNVFLFAILNEDGRIHLECERETNDGED